jgi:hypothetical protein
MTLEFPSPNPSNSRLPTPAVTPKQVEKYPGGAVVVEVGGNTSKFPSILDGTSYPEAPYIWVTLIMKSLI